MKNEQFYTVEFDKTGDQYSTCYWVFDTLKQAKGFYDKLKRGCTIYSINITLYEDTKHKRTFIEGWSLGDEDHPGMKYEPIKTK